MDIEEFADFLKNENKSTNTIKGYIADIRDYNKWFHETFSKDFTIIIRQNILEYKSYLQNIKRNNAKTINHKLSSLLKYNHYLVYKNIQKEIAIENNDKIKIQLQYASPTKVTETEVKQFLQSILESKNLRNYALMVFLAYTGLRISEALNIKMDDFDLEGKECIIRTGKGDKQRSVMLNSKVITAVKEYLKVRSNISTANGSNYLFVSRKNKKLDRTTVNRIFKKYSNSITPHQLRHFFCTNALEKGMLAHEVANQAGHSNIHTTLLYTNPDKKKLIDKMERL
ncbi:MAG: Tyrosine recombinase XerD [Firmicutes bacterium ADurb.Bin419]|nr:MAG: Tyrosine recombinase XerD [Firmicutes bacterium ADurb.Bin419]